MDASVNSFVADVVWIGRGIAKAVPDKVQLDENDLKELLQSSNIKETTDDNSDSDEEEKIPEKSGLRGSATNLANDGENFDLENYDKEDAKLRGPSMKGLAYYASQLDDPYITRHNDSEEEEEREDFELKPSDNLVAVAKTSKDDYSIDVYVYNEDNDDWYLHHDYILEAPPLCLAHIPYDPNSETDEKGNFLAVGTMEPTIGIWDLNIVNTLEPVVTLGEKAKKVKTKKGEKSRKKRDGSGQGHSDAVLSLGWNSHLEHILASGSSDNTVVLWDLDETKAAQCLNLDGMVQSLRWHPFEDSILLTGTRNGVVSVLNCKSVDDNSAKLNWSLGGDVEVENVLWNRFQPYCAFVCSNDGKLRYLDTRKPGEFITEVLAHEGGTNSVTQSFHIRNLLVTAGAKEVKVWRLENNASFRPVYERQMNMGSVQVVRFSPDSGCVLAVGANSEDNARVLDLAAIDTVVNTFNSTASGDGGEQNAGSAPMIKRKEPKPEVVENDGDDEEMDDNEENNNDDIDSDDDGDEDEEMES